jgi:hypothetical protein
VIESLNQPHRGLARYSEEQLGLAAVRATRRWSRWFGGIDTCLVRSLVFAALLAERGEVVLHIGFQPGVNGADLDGHAWVTLDGVPVGVDSRFDQTTVTGTLEMGFSSNRGGSS